MRDLNYVVVSGHLAKDAIFREQEEGAPCTEIILVNNRLTGGKDEEGNRREVVTPIKVLFWGSMALGSKSLRKGDELLVIGGHLRSDNIRIPNAVEGEPQYTTGRLRVESAQRFVILPKLSRQEEPMDAFEEKMLQGEKDE